MTGPLATAGATVLALAASAAFSFASVLQQREARTAPARHALHPQLVVDLLRRPVWLAGGLVGIAGFFLEASALYFGPITLVQPLIITELLFALPLAARLAGGRLRVRERIGAALVVAGLAAFLSSAAPTQGSTEISASHTAAVLVVVTAIVTAALLIAPKHRGLLRTSMFATATGVTSGAMSGFLKAVVGLLAVRGLGVLATWQLWSFVVLALSGLVLAQSTFQAGPLAVGLPLIDALIPLTAGVIAVAAFGEHINHTPAVAVVEVLAAAATIAGIAVLDTSPLVQRAQRNRLPVWATPHDVRDPCRYLAPPTALSMVVASRRRPPLTWCSGRHRVSAEKPPGGTVPGDHIVWAAGASPSRDPRAAALPASPGRARLIALATAATSRIRAMSRPVRSRPRFSCPRIPGPVDA